jgi:hypothetical protein
MARATTRIITTLHTPTRARAPVKRKNLARHLRHLKGFNANAAAMVSKKPAWAEGRVSDHPQRGQTCLALLFTLQIPRSVDARRFRALHHKPGVLPDTRRAGGLGFDRIAARLNEEGVPSRTGRPWHGFVRQPDPDRAEGRMTAPRARKPELHLPLVVVELLISKQVL